MSIKEFFLMIFNYKTNKHISFTGYPKFRIIDTD